MLHIVNLARDFFGRLRRLSRQVLNFAGDNRKAFARFTRTRGFNRGVQGQKVGLLSDIGNHADNNTNAASRIYAQYYLPFQAFLAAGAIYLVASFVLIGIFRLAEQRFLGYLAPRKH